MSNADLRMALQQNQPIGDRRFYAEVEAMTGQRRELKRRFAQQLSLAPFESEDLTDTQADLARGLGHIRSS